MDKQIKLKLSNITNKNNSDVSSFSLIYSGKKLDKPEVSYQIISALKAETFLFLELNSTLLNMGTNDKMVLASKFREELQNFGIQFISKKITDNEKRRVLSIALEGRKVEGYEIYALIPNEIWCDPEFKKVIPEVGIRYYLPFENSESNLSAFVDLDEEEKLKISKMVIFDHALLASMGITTTHLAKTDMDQLLK